MGSYFWPVAATAIILMAGCMDGQEAIRGDPGRSPVPIWQEKDEIRLDLHVPAGGYAEALAPIDYESTGLKVGDSLFLPYSLSMEFPRPSPPGSIFFSEVYVIMADEQRQYNAYNVGARQTWNTILVPEGATGVRIRTPGEEFPIDAPLRLVGAVAGGTVPFTVHYSASLKAKYGNVSTYTTQNGSLYREGSSAQGPIPINGSSELEWEADGKTFLLAGLIEHPPANERLTNQNEAELAVEHGCAERFVYHASGSLHSSEEYEPPVAAGYPRSEPLVPALCPEASGSALGTVHLSATYSGFSTFRTFAFVTDYHPAKTWLSLL